MGSACLSFGCLPHPEGTPHGASSADRARVTRCPTEPVPPSWHHPSASVPRSGLWIPTGAAACFPQPQGRAGGGHTGLTSTAEATESIWENQGRSCVSVGRTGNLHLSTGWSEPPGAASTASKVTKALTLFRSMVPGAPHACHLPTWFHGPLGLLLVTETCRSHFLPLPLPCPPAPNCPRCTFSSSKANFTHSDPRRPQSLEGLRSRLPSSLSGSVLQSVHLSDIR